MRRINSSITLRLMTAYVALPRLHKHGKRIEMREEQEVIHHTRTSKAYEETMRQFRAGLQRQGLDLESDPGKVALLAQAFAHGSNRGRQVKATTANLRLAILSSFYDVSQNTSI
jgi:hypothetical protein